jgi:glutamine phosphoribosylpyrophosphate amidotransferase
VTATEAISRIGTESDTDLLKAHLANEKRRTVIDALKKRLAEVDGGAE